MKLPIEIAGIKILAWVKFAIFLVLAFVLSGFISTTIKKLLSKRVSAQQRLIVGKITYALVFLIFAMTALQQLGFNLSILLGTAGIFTLAIGFASQTAASNLISGLFLIFERPFIIGNLIKVNGITGELISIDLLSVKLKTPENLYVRVPNDVMLKSPITNVSKFSTRRFGCDIGVAYDCNLAEAVEALLNVARNNELCLSEPAPSIVFTSFADSAIQLQLRAWATQANYFKMKLSLAKDIQEKFSQIDIEIPFPQMSISLSKETINALQNSVD